MLTGSAPSAFDSSRGHFSDFMFYVYILYSQNFDKYYVGQTNDIEQRLNRHNKGSEKSTSPYRPWVMVWYGTKTSRSGAVILERKLKNLSKDRIKKFVAKYS